MRAERDDDGSFVGALPARFTADDVRRAAKDTCQNWFYKLAGSRSLVGRIYMEAALSRSHFFVRRGSVAVGQCFSRLAAMCRGIGNPLMACYARMYVARRGHALLPDPERAFARTLMADAVAAYRAACEGKHDALASAGLVPMGRVDYVTLMLPAVRYCVARCVEMTAAGGPPAEAELKQVLQHLSGAMDAASLPLLAAFVDALPAKAAARWAPQLAALLTATSRSLAEPKPAAGAAMDAVYRAAQAECLACVGAHMSACPPRPEHRRPVLNQTWRLAMQYDTLDAYLPVAVAFAPFIAQHFGLAEIGVLLR